MMRLNKLRKKIGKKLDKAKDEAARIIPCIPRDIALKNIIKIRVNLGKDIWVDLALESSEYILDLSEFLIENDTRIRDLKPIIERRIYNGLDNHLRIQSCLPEEIDIRAHGVSIRLGFYTYIIINSENLPDKWR